MLSNLTSDSTAGDVNCCIKAQDYFIAITALPLKHFKYRRCLSVKIRNKFYKIICLLYIVSMKLNLLALCNMSVIRQLLKYIILLLVSVFHSTITFL